jgi:hypothetical protein
MPGPKPKKPLAECLWRLLFLNRLPVMSDQVIKASISLVAVATSAGSLFVISWIGLALLGF